MRPIFIAILIVISSIGLHAQMPPMPGAVPTPAPTKPLLSPRAKTTAFTGKAMSLALPPVYYYRAFYALSPLEATTTDGAYGLYGSPTNQQANIFLGLAPQGSTHINFTGPLPANPINLWVVYTAGGSNNAASPVVLLNTNFLPLSTNPVLPRIVYLKPQIFVAPPTNLTILSKPVFPSITIQGTTNLHDWYPVGTTTNGLLTVICSQFEESYRARVDASTVTIGWWPSTSQNVTGYLVIQYDSNTNIITTTNVGNVTNAAIFVQRPDKCVRFAIESLDEIDGMIGPPSVPTFYKPSWPTLRISR